MKRLKHIINIAFTAMLLLCIAVSCEESGSLSIDPIEVEATFTFEPARGFAGNSITIKGNDFSDVLKVSFGINEAEILQKNNEEISVIVPVGAITSKLKLVKSNSILVSTESFEVDETPVPIITEFAPAIVGSGDIVSITGTLINRVDSVYVGELKVEIQPGVSETSMEIVVPEGFQTSRIIMYYNYMTDYGMEKVAESVSMTEISLELPSITAIDLDITALNIGDELTISGTMFDEVTMVQFAGVDAAYTVVNETEMTVTVPVGVVTGTITLTVFDGIIESDEFKIVLPTITSFVPYKGDEQAEDRSFSLQGTMLNLVTAVKIGDADAVIETISPEVIIFSAAGNASGIITLVTNNGDVKSDVPYIITGDFWIVDFDNSYEPNRFGYADANKVDDANVSNETGGPTGIYGHATGTTIPDNRPRVYIRSIDGGGFTVPDAFQLYTSDPNDVYFSVDVNIKDIPAELLNDDGTVDLEIYAFSSRVGSAAPNPPYGFSKVVNLPYEQGNDTWHHLNLELADFVEDTDLEGTGTTGSAGGLRPDRLRIMTLFFLKSATTASPFEVNFDNVKFTIE